MRDSEFSIERLLSYERHHRLIASEPGSISFPFVDPAELIAAGFRLVGFVSSALVARRTIPRRMLLFFFLFFFLFKPVGGSTMIRRSFAISSSLAQTLDRRFRRHTTILQLADLPPVFSNNSPRRCDSFLIVVFVRITSEGEME